MEFDKGTKNILFSLLPDEIKKIFKEKVKNDLKKAVDDFKSKCTNEEFLILDELVHEKAEEIKKSRKERTCESCIGHEILSDNSVPAILLEQTKKVCGLCRNFSRHVNIN